MKKYFKYSPQSNQYYLNYKGLPINIDKDEFDLMSDNDVIELIKSLTTQTVKKRSEEQIVPHDEGKKLFQMGLKKIKPENFREFYDFMSNA